MGKRLMIFIDGSNVYKEAKRYFGDDCRIDYCKLIKELSGNEDFIRAYYYGSKGWEDEGEGEAFKKFTDFLNYNGIKTIIKSLVKRDGKYREKGVDVALATDLLSFGFVNAYDIAFVVSGDGDLADVIERVQSLGKIIKVAFFEKSTAEKLKLASDENIYLDNIIDDIKMT